MSKELSEQVFQVFDTIALQIQKLGSKELKKDIPLVRIRYDREKGEAPFVLDMAEGIVHRQKCRKIPRESRSALYAIESIPDDKKINRCPYCKPMNEEKKSPAEFDPTDILFGVLSIIDQFGAVLSQRGRDFRATTQGKRMERSIGSVLKTVDSNQKDSTAFLSRFLDSAISSINKMSDTLETKPAPGSPGKKGANKANTRKKR